MTQTLKVGGRNISQKEKVISVKYFIFLEADMSAE